MPLYEYRCRKCGAQVEKIQKFSDPPLETCAACGGQLERLLSTPAVHFKGSGWYVTDYARKSSSPPANSEGSTSDKPKTPSAGESKKPPDSAKGPAKSKPSSD